MDNACGNGGYIATFNRAYNRRRGADLSILQSAAGGCRNSSNRRINKPTAGNGENLKRGETMKRKIKRFCVALVLTLALFAVARNAAVNERGNNAVGGEIMTLCAPVIYYAIKAERSGEKRKAQ